MRPESDATRLDRRLRAAGLRRDDRAASEIVGSLLLISITVLLVSGLSILVLNVKPPADILHADLSMLVTRGSDGAWGTGDEQLRVQHNGGETIPQDGLTVTIDIDGSILTYADSGLTGTAFDDEEFTIGELWNVTLTVPVEAPVTVQMVLEDGRSSILITNSLVRAGGSCEPDTVAPTVLTWNQSPADVTASTSGAVTVTVRLVDACVGVDETVDPHLEFRLNDGTDPAWTDLGAMNDAGTDSWTGLIPDQTWVSQISNSLQYRVTGMTDETGNSGTSPFRSDVIQFTGTDTFVSGNTPNLGTVDSFANMRSDTDGGALATLTETTGIPPTAYHASSATGSGGTGTASDVAGAADDAYYVLNSNNDNIVSSTFNTAGGGGTITQVTMIFEGHYEGTRSDDTIDLAADAGSGFSTVLDNYVPTFGSSGNDVQQSVDITGLRGSWSFTDVADLELRATYDRSGQQDNMEVHVDSMWVVVTVSGSTELDVEFTFPAPPVLATTHVLEMEYNVDDEVFHVEVWDGITWNRRGVELDQTSQTIWVYVLTGTEAVANGGSPLIRIVDDDGSSPAGNIKIDYLKVVSG